MKKTILSIALLLGVLVASNAENKKTALVVNSSEKTNYVELTSDVTIKINTTGETPTVDVYAKKTDATPKATGGTSLTIEEVDFDAIATALETIAAEKEVKAIEYYTVAGVKIAEPQKGVTIIKVLYTDGTAKTLKTIKK